MPSAGFERFHCRRKRGRFYRSLTLQYLSTGNSHSSSTRDRRREVLELMSAAAAWFEPAQTIAECRYAKDIRYLKLALVAGAKVIVSGGDDLLVLDQWRGTRIMKQAAFLA